MILLLGTSESAAAVYPSDVGECVVEGPYDCVGNCAESMSMAWRAWFSQRQEPHLASRFILAVMAAALRRNFW